jgi:hypothetical protein
MFHWQSSRQDNVRQLRNWRDMISVRQHAVGPFDMSKSFRVLMLLILAPWSLVSQTADSDATVIAEHIEIPAYPPLARQARMSGEVKLRLLVQRSGEVVSVSVASVAVSDGVPASSALAHTVIDGIRESFVDVATRAAEKSQFSCPTCKGATFDHSITYQFQHPPVPKRACNPRPKDKIPPLPGPTIDSPNHVTVRPTAWPCVDSKLASSNYKESRPVGDFACC